MSSNKGEKMSAIMMFQGFFFFFFFFLIGGLKFTVELITCRRVEYGHIPFDDKKLSFYWNADRDNYRRREVERLYSFFSLKTLWNFSSFSSLVKTKA